MGSMGSDVRISDTFEQAAPESSNKPRHSLVTGLATNPLRGLLHGVEVDVQAELRGSVVGDLTAHLRDVHELHAEQTVLDEFLHQLRAVLTSVGAGLAAVGALRGRELRRRCRRSGNNWTTTKGPPQRHPSSVGGRR